MWYFSLVTMFQPCWPFSVSFPQIHRATLHFYIFKFAVSSAKYILPPDLPWFISTCHPRCQLKCQLPQEELSCLILIILSNVQTPASPSHYPVLLFQNMSLSSVTPFLVTVSVVLLDKLCVNRDSICLVDFCIPDIQNYSWYYSRPSFINIGEWGKSQCLWGSAVLLQLSQFPLGRGSWLHQVPKLT